MTVDYENMFAGFLNEAADLAGSIALKYFRSNLDIDDKEDRTPVTKADREIECRLRELINKKFPNHGIIGEEYGKERADAEFVWVLDPIDGTKAFITGKPQFGTIIGIAHKGAPAVGLVDQPFTKERWMGVANRFCNYNGSPVKVAAPRKLKEARCFVGSPEKLDSKYYKGYDTLRSAVKVTQYNGDCYAYGLLSMGAVDVVTEYGLGLYDVLGIIPLVSGAGGYTGGWDGREINLNNMDGSFVAASSKKLAVSAVAMITEGV